MRLRRRLWSLSRARWPASPASKTSVAAASSSTAIDTSVSRTSGRLMMF